MMTDRREQRTADVEHIGGPYDGTSVRVDVDEHGQPPEFYIARKIGPADFSIDPMYGAQSRIISHMYRLGVRADEVGVRWTYVFEAETATDAAA